MSRERVVGRNLSQENRVRLSEREEGEGAGRHQKEAKRMGRGYHGEERPRELGRDKMQVKRMG